MGIASLISILIAIAIVVFVTVKLVADVLKQRKMSWRMTWDWLRKVMDALWGAG